MTEKKILKKDKWLVFNSAFIDLILNALQVLYIDETISDLIYTLC